MRDFFYQLWAKKKCTIIGMFLFSLLAIILFGLYGIIDIGGVLKVIINANIAVLGIDIAAFAILFAVFHEKSTDESAKEAFDEQSISFLGNALFQLLAIILSIMYGMFQVSFFFWVSLGFQIFALIHVFDIIFELYTLTTIITKKQ